MEQNWLQPTYNNAWQIYLNTQLSPSAWVKYPIEDAFHSNFLSDPLVVYSIEDNELELKIQQISLMNFIEVHVLQWIFLSTLLNNANLDLVKHKKCLTS